MHWRPMIGFRGVVSIVQALILSGFIAAPGWGQESKSDGTGPVGPAVLSPEQVVREQVEAYNRHDVEAFLMTYSPEVKVFDFPDKFRFSGLEAMRERYDKLFKSEPDLKVKITRRIVQGKHVIDHEEVTMGRGRRLTAVAIYRVEGGKITDVWFMR